MNRRTLTLATLCGVALACVVWLAAPEPAAPPHEPEPRATVAPTVHAAQATAHRPPQPPTASSAAANGPVDTTVELCGTGRVPVRAASHADAFNNLPAPVGRDALRELQERLLRTLAAGNAQQRVAAGLLRQPDTPDPAAQAAWATSLLAQARASGDAQALRWAAAACSHTDDPARCRIELNAARLQAEPDNGLHWLEWAQDVSNPNEQALAWQSMVRASQWRERPQSLTALTQAALSAMQPAPPAYLRAQIARDTLGRDAAQAPGSPPWLEQQCSQQTSDCAQMAERMQGQADSAALLQQAAALGRQLGWAEERLQALTAATQAFHAQLPSWPDGPDTALACSSAEPALAHVEAVARRGEVRAAQIN